MTDILGIPIAYGKLSKSTGDHYRFIPYHGPTAYRVIVSGVEGSFEAGFTNYVVCKEFRGWTVRDFVTAKPVGTETYYPTRDAATAHAIRHDDAKGGNMRGLS